MNHKFKSDRSGQGHRLAALPYVLILEGHHVPQPVAVKPEPLPTRMPRDPKGGDSRIRPSFEDHAWSCGFGQSKYGK